MSTEGSPLGDVVVYQSTVEAGASDVTPAVRRVVDAIRDGWLCTGDLGYLDEDGFLFIEGRVTEIIKSGGFRISPGEVEDVLIRHPAVSEVAVLGLADSQNGEMVLAVLALKEGQAVSEVELIRHCKSILPAHKIPQRIVLLPELPKSASGKLQKESLAKLFAPSTERIINNPEIR